MKKVTIILMLFLITNNFIIFFAGLVAKVKSDSFYRNTSAAYQALSGAYAALQSYEDLGKPDTIDGYVMLGKSRVEYILKDSAGAPVYIRSTVTAPGSPKFTREYTVRQK